jgi:hypothetical protein
LKLSRGGERERDKSTAIEQATKEIQSSQAEGISGKQPSKQSYQVQRSYFCQSTPKEDPR